MPLCVEIKLLNPRTHFFSKSDRISSRFPFFYKIHTGCFGLTKAVTRRQQFYSRV